MNPFLNSLNSSLAASRAELGATRELEDEELKSEPSELDGEDELNAGGKKTGRHHSEAIRKT